MDTRKAEGGYGMPSVEEVVRNVRRGDRTKADLKRCGCSVCTEALQILGKR